MKKIIFLVMIFLFFGLLFYQFKDELVKQGVLRAANTALGLEMEIDQAQIAVRAGSRVAIRL